MPLPMALFRSENPPGSHQILSPTQHTIGRRRYLCRATLWIGLLLAAYQLLWTFYLAGVNIPDVEIDPVTGQRRTRRRPHLLKKKNKVTGEEIPTSPFDGIMEGYLTLISIKIPTIGLLAGTDRKYQGVMGLFCHIAWKLQDTDPTAVPNFDDLRDNSPLCLGTRFQADLWDITRSAQEYDWRNHTFAATKPKPGQGPVPPTATVFHQTRCGSTLIANVLAAFMSQHTRVYSEHPAPVAALMACGEDGNDLTCDETAQDALIQDVFYMLGRTPGPTLPQYVFYKFQSVASHYIHVFARAMPDTPWIFSYRDPIEIIMSHFKNYQKGNPLAKDFVPNCLRNYGEDNHPAILKELVTSVAGKTIDSLSKEEYCAAHLASLGEAVLWQHEHSKDKGPKRWFVHYDELPFRIWETKNGILPQLDLFISQEQKEKMLHVSRLHSKGENAGEHWKEDKTVKQGTAPESVRAAVDLFMKPVYERLEKYRLEYKD